MKSSALTPVALAVALAATSAARAQADASPAAQTIVVTGSAVESALRDAPASIAVLTRSDIEKRPVQELAELLGTVPGVTLSRSGNAAVPGVQLRGLAAAYTLVLIDGKRVNSTSASFRGNDYDLGWVPTEEIERIEVVRGPMSSLYGSDAIGGVVNIITRKVGKAWRGSVRLDAVQQENELAGDSRIASFSVAGPLVADTLGVKLYGGYDERNADDAALNPAAANGTRQPAMPKMRNKYLSSQIAWTPSADHDVFFDYDRADRDHGGTLLEREAYSIRHKGRYAFGSSDLRVYADETRNLVGTVTGQINPNKAQTQAVDGRISLPVEWGVPQTISLGGEVRRDKLTDKANLSGPPNSTPRADPSTEVGQKALFIEDEIRFTERFALTIGDRYDRHDNFGGNHSPRAYGVFHITPLLTLKGGVARAFRAPTLLQNSPDWGSVSCGSPTPAGCYIVGSTLLEPETSTSRELGLVFDSSRWGASLTLFDNQLRNMIDISNRTADRALADKLPNFVGFMQPLLTDGRPIFRYQNINSVRTRGAETSARLALTPQLALRAAYTYTDAKNTSGAKELPLTYRPREVGNVAVDWQPLAGWSLGANARYNGSQVINVQSNGATLTAPAYSLLDLTAAWQIDPRFTLRAGALNAANRTIERTTTNEFNEDGRRWFVSLGARF